MTCGIYCIENIVNHKKYIGQSVDIERRWKEHIKELADNNHQNQYLQNSWNMYDSINFTFTIIENCNQNDLDYYEAYWIKFYKTLNRKYGYNLRDGGSRGRFSKESIEKIRQSQIGLSAGKKNGSAKITEDQALQIINLLLSGHSIIKIQKKLGIPYKTIYHIRNKETWRHLTKDITFPCLGTSKYKGVSWDKSCKKWKARVVYNKNVVFLDYFASELEAAKARDGKAKEYFGDKAVLNFN